MRIIFKPYGESDTKLRMNVLRKFKSLSFKLWFTIISGIILSVLFAYSLSQYYYKNLYIEKVKT